MINLRMFCKHEWVYLSTDMKQETSVSGRLLERTYCIHTICKKCKTQSEISTNAYLKNYEKLKKFLRLVNISYSEDDFD